MIRRSLKYMKLEKIMSPIFPIGAWYMRVSPRMITCKQFNDFIFDYVGGNLSEKESVLFMRHMRVCPMCRQFLRNYIAALKASEMILPFDDTVVPESVPQDLIEAIIDVKNSKGE